VIEEMARASAGHAVEGELLGDAPRMLFAEITLEDRPGDARFDAEMTGILRRSLGTATSEDRRAFCDLWTSIDAVAGPAEAWKGTLSALFRDPAFVSR